MNNKTANNELQPIEKYRSELGSNTQLLEVMDLGAGTKARKKQITIGSMAKAASVNKRHGKLLYNLTNHYRPDTIIELGTAFGISTMYLAQGNPQARVITVEGNPQLAEMASHVFKANNLNNITLMNSMFENALAPLISMMGNNTLVYIDGNHTYKATLQYYNVFGKKHDSSVILVFDDINWSPEMRRAWKYIIKTTRSGFIIDLFHMGIVFQGQGRNRQKCRFSY